MTWTWRDIMSDALVRSRMVGRGQIIQEKDFSNAQEVLELLLDELDGNGYNLPSLSTNLTFNTVANQAKYMLGKDVSDVAGATSIRPEEILVATITIAANPVVRITLKPLSFGPNMYIEQAMIPTPGIPSQPWNFAVNETWPQSEFYLYPVPSQIYPVSLTAKVKWADTVGDPALNPFAIAEIPSGYVAALTSILTARIVKWWRDPEPVFEDMEQEGMFFLAGLVANQIPPDSNKLPIGYFPWNIGIAGVNP